MSDGDGEVVTVSVLSFARHHDVTVFTVWRWIREGKIAAQKDPGGHRWRIIVKNTPSKTKQTPPTTENSE